MIKKKTCNTLKMMQTTVVNPIFNDAAKFGHVRLELGMEFTTRCKGSKTFNDDHTCERTFKNRCATRSWVTDILVKKARNLPTFRHCEVFNYFKAKIGIQFSRTTITRALGNARKIVRLMKLQNMLNSKIIQRSY
ncbi:hypothetical protein Ahy_A04g020320 isoform A [Arachis hypogaea]|uniref:Transposase MuDR plant domain-containing protein n=1 Tax=Arachis hypogaea TaxID=3818 RepID=A0A445DHF8_ARAHY|nr:hypothetical protein Ahy_A04g020320 isoform A [Arachis hypogaea]